MKLTEMFRKDFKKLKDLSEAEFMAKYPSYIKKLQDVGEALVAPHIYWSAWHEVRDEGKDDV